MRLKIEPTHKIVYQHPYWRSRVEKISVESDLLCRKAELGANRFIGVKESQEECGHCKWDLSVSIDSSIGKSDT